MFVIVGVGILHFQLKKMLFVKENIDIRRIAKLELLINFYY